MFNIYTEYLIREALDDGIGINTNGQSIKNIIYADDTIILAETALYPKNRQADGKLDVTWKGTKLDHTHSPVYLGITLDR